MGTYDYKGYKVAVTKPLYGSTKITFKNVPIYVPNSELIHLVKTYGKMDKEEIHHEKMHIKTDGGKIFTSPSTTRHAFATILANKHMRRFSLMEENVGKRIVVEHPVQERQCSSCLDWAKDCPGIGRGI